MEDNKLKVKLVNRTDTKENWKSENPVLLEGEFGIEKDGDAIADFKIGDGKTPWNDLKYSKPSIPNKADTNGDELNGPGVVTIDLGENPYPEYEAKPEDKIIRFINSKEKPIITNKELTKAEIDNMFDPQYQNCSFRNIKPVKGGSITIINDTQVTYLDYYTTQQRKFTYNDTESWTERITDIEWSPYIYVILLASWVEDGGYGPAPNVDELKFVIRKVNISGTVDTRFWKNELNFCGICMTWTARNFYNGSLYNIPMFIVPPHIYATDLAVGYDENKRTGNDSLVMYEAGRASVQFIMNFPEGYGDKILDGEAVKRLLDELKAGEVSNQDIIDTVKQYKETGPYLSAISRAGIQPNELAELLKKVKDMK